MSRNRALCRLQPVHQGVRRLRAGDGDDDASGHDLCAGGGAQRIGTFRRLSSSTYLYALAAGLCIGSAEIGYFYLFGNVGGIKPMAANVAIPAIVIGTIVITMVVAHFLLREVLSFWQVVGIVLVVGGIVLLFVGGKGGSAAHA